MKPLHGWVSEFHETFDVDPKRRRESSWKFIREEVVELKAALDSGNRVDIARELADLVYVAYGAAIAHEIYLDYAIEEVHQANMRKLGKDGKPIKDSDGKVLKPENWIVPSMSKAIARRQSVVSDAD